MKTLFSVILVLSSFQAFSQQRDTIEMAQISVSGKRLWKDSAGLLKYYQLKQSVFKLKPLVEDVLQDLDELEDTLDKITTKKQREAHLKWAEANILPYYVSEIRNLGRKDGLLFLKMVSERAGVSCYDLIRRFKSRTACIKYLVAARIYTVDLKRDYSVDNDPLLDFAIQSVFE